MESWLRNNAANNSQLPILNSQLLLQSLFYFYFFVRLDDIAYLDIIAVGQADTTLEISTNFFHIVFETFQGVNRTGEDHNTVADKTCLVATF